MTADILTELNLLDEHHRLEAKACRSGELGTSFFETVCAFSNEPKLGGGTIILGVSRDEDDPASDYEAHGVTSPDQIQLEIATGCANRFNVAVRPKITLEEYEGKSFIIVEIEERPAGEKPLYFAKQSLPRGAWRRIGSSDQRCTDDDMIVFYGNRSGESHDLILLPHASLDDLDPDEIEYYRTLRRRANSRAEELAWNDHDLLASLNAIRKNDQDIWTPTLTGLLLFGTRMAYRRELPMVRVDYIRVAGKAWVSDSEERFEKTVDMRGPLLPMVDRVLAAVMDDLPKGFELVEGQVQANTPTLPARALREAIVNALMHRSYREHQPTQVIRYSNRIEIRNAGFSLKNEDSLGETGSQLRNPTLAAVFHETNTAETKGSGIRTMRRLMKENGFSLPTFESNHRDSFFVSRFLLHHFLSESDLRWLSGIPSSLSDSQRIALIFLREQGAVDNQTLRQLTGSDVLTASAELRKLKDLNLLEQKGKSSATYYLPGPDLPERELPKSEAEHGTLDPSHGTLDPNHVTLAPSHVTLEPSHVTLEKELPAKILTAIRDLGKKPALKIRPVILQLCSFRPYTVAELSMIFGGRNPRALKNDHLKPMIRDRSLSYTYPDMEKHPKQAYRTTNS